MKEWLNFIKSYWFSIMSWLLGFCLFRDGLITEFGKTAGDIMNGIIFMYLGYSSFNYIFDKIHSNEDSE